MSSIPAETTDACPTFGMEAALARGHRQHPLEPEAVAASPLLKALPSAISLNFFERAPDGA